MSLRANLISVCLLLLALCSHMSSAQISPPASNADQLTIPPRVLPLSPKEVLNLLPPTPSDWKVTASAATNQITSWVVTIAQRQIESSKLERPSSTGPNSPPTPPMRTTFMLIDSGYDPSATGAFVDFKPSNNGNVEKAFFLTFPIIRTRSSATAESLQMLINRRFVFRVDAENQPKDSVLRWAQQLPISQYNRAPTATMIALPPQVVVRSVDELNPRNDHESTITTATPKPSAR